MTELKIRFRTDDGSAFPDWEEVRFGDVFTEISQKTSDTDTYPLYSLTIEDGVTAKSERYERSYLLTKDEDNYKIVPPNAFVYNPMNLRFGALAPNHQDMKVCVSQYYNVFEIKDESTLVFWENYLVSSLMLKHYFSIATGSLIEKLRVHYTNFVEIRKRLPSLPEQQKIADFLNNVDEVIAASEEEVANLEKQKKAVMQKIFSQEVRFKREDGRDFPDWEEQPLSYYMKENKKRNKDKKFAKEDVLSVSKDYGVVNQIDYFGKSLAGDDLSNYHCVDEGNVIYTKSPLGKQPYGIIRYSKTTGVVSTLYAVYSCNNNVLPEFIDYYFSRDKVLNNYLKPLVNIGAKHDMKVNNDVAISGLVVFPSSIEEQKLIVNLLVEFDGAITAARQELEKWKELKKGLLQQMFV